MKRNNSSKAFRTVLVLLNVLAMMYPITLLLRANDVDQSLLGTGVLLGSLFLLVVIDVVTIVAVSAIDAKKP
jgi:hypothetical protein